MVILNRIYTKTGDHGTTALGNGERVFKDDLRVEAYGSVDETNAAIGLARCYIQLPVFADLDHMLLCVQHDLFDLGAELCTPLSSKHETQAPRLKIEVEQVTFLEQSIDFLNKELPALRSFVLPSGTPLAAHLHLARTLCRRAERRMVSLQKAEKEENQQEAILEPSFQYINRLSDFLFVASRWVNIQEFEETLWIPAHHRQKTPHSTVQLNSEDHAP